MKSLIIIPTYNEKDNIERMVRKVLSIDRGYHMLIVDDGSPDGTAAIVKRLKAENDDRLFIIEREGKLGLGTAYITAFKWALENHYDFIFEMDADFSHNPDDLVRLHDACLNGADLAIGSRYIKGINVVNWPIGRILISYLASKYVRVATGMRVMDPTAGFKCYKANTLRAINLDKIKMAGYGFQIEMKFTVWKLGFKIVELPIVFTDRKLGVSKMSGGIFNEALWGVAGLKLKSWFVPFKTIHRPKEISAN